MPLILSCSDVDCLLKDDGHRSTPHRQRPLDRIPKDAPDCPSFVDPQFLSCSIPRQYCTISRITDNMSLSILRVPHFLRLHTLCILFALLVNSQLRLQN
ncbi:hypothetical protein BLNAU_3824 [Blattamonas nauphoetae]|uniref:Uncharacterized protein n=1 Tax=Blattamonas nauphoetae TaxID=2049346 RepID=A0ABQ9YBL4_9EUKA|nr:hypothetical protein BLNAU_3824 [Blattamonas nauphoetae]